VTVTVLLPVYNGAATLGPAIESVLSQDDQDFTLLIIDDSSTDGSASTAAEYAQRDSRIHLVRHLENRGLAATLNEGLALADTELVLRMDQDDLALPRRLGVQRAFMQTHPQIAVAGSDVLHMGRTPAHDRLVRLPRSPRQVAIRLQTENCLYHPSVVIRRHQILDLGGYRDSFRNSEDYDLWLRVAGRHDLANIPEPLIRYRFSVRGMTLSRKWEQLFYVYLAQEANRDTQATSDELHARADEALSLVNRRAFMRQVALGTVDELIALGLRKDAFRVISGFARDVGAPTFTRLVYRIIAGRAPRAKTPQLARSA
jgi:glycosyltransferase involved in cell wall biosynthesis